MLRALADEDVPWDSVHVVQVDERIAPAGDPDRNLTHLRESLLSQATTEPLRLYSARMRRLLSETRGPASRIRRRPSSGP
jgi:6-phosphogluconolactonase/glucosamine-6-phosphate isomerase/deaminase